MICFLTHSFACAHTTTHTHTCTYMYSYTIHTCAHTTHTHTCTYSHTIHTCAHTCTCTYSHTMPYVWTHTHTHQKEHVDLQRTFSSWKLRHVNDKRELFTSTLARRHYHHRVMSRVWAAWFGVVQGRWKQRVEKACQVYNIITYVSGTCVMLQSLCSYSEQSRRSVCTVDWSV